MLKNLKKKWRNCLPGGVENINSIAEILNRFDFVKSVTREVGKIFPVWIVEIEKLSKVDFFSKSRKKVGSDRKQFFCDTKDIAI